MFRCCVAVVTRSTGRSAAGACAYVAAGVATDVASGVTLDYGRKAGVVEYGFAHTKNRTLDTFAAALDGAEKRCDSRVAREVICNLPHTATDETRRQIAEQIATDMHTRWGVPVMYALHRAPDDGDTRNEHVHFIIGTRNREGAKVLALDSRKTGPQEIAWLRAQVAQRIQSFVPAEERPEWDHRSYAARGIDRIPQRHEGPQLTAMRRREYALAKKEGRAPKPLRSPRARYNDALRVAYAEQAEAEREEQAATEQLAQVAAERAALRAEIQAEAKAEIATIIYEQQQLRSLREKADRILERTACDLRDAERGAADAARYLAGAAQDGAGASGEGRGRGDDSAAIADRIRDTFESLDGKTRPAARRRRSALARSRFSHGHSNTSPIVGGDAYPVGERAAGDLGITGGNAGGGGEDRGRQERPDYLGELLKLVNADRERSNAQAAASGVIAPAPAKKPMEPLLKTPEQIRAAIKTDLRQDKGPEPGQTTGGRRR